MTHAVPAQIMFFCVMHIDTVPNRKARPSYLLRKSVREGKRVEKITIANLSSLSDRRSGCFAAC